MPDFDIDEDVFEKQTPEVRRAMLASFQKQLDARRAAAAKRVKKPRVAQKKKPDVNGHGFVSMNSTNNASEAVDMTVFSTKVKKGNTVLKKAPIREQKKTV